MRRPDSAPPLALLIDRDGEIFYCNRDHAGTSREALLQTRAPHLFVEQEAIEELLTTVFESNQPRRFEATDQRGEELSCQLIPLGHNSALIVATKPSDTNTLDLRTTTPARAGSRIAGEVAHDLANLLAVATILLSDVIESEQISDRGRHSIEQVLSALSCSTTTVRELLPQHLESRRVPADLGRVLLEAADLTRPLLPAEVELVIETHPTPVHIVCDPCRAVRVIVNLILNAIDAVEATGRPGRIVASCSVVAEQAVLRVSDTGTGISPEHLPRLFEPHFTTKPAQQGSGIGLTMAYDYVVGELDGTMDVDTQLGEGTVFTVKIPLRRALAAV